MTQYIPYIALLISFLSLLLALTKFITDEKRLRRKEQAERLQHEQSQLKRVSILHERTNTQGTRPTP